MYQSRAGERHQARFYLISRFPMRTKTPDCDSGLFREPPRPTENMKIDIPPTRSYPKGRYPHNLIESFLFPCPPSLSPRCPPKKRSRWKAQGWADEKQLRTKTPYGKFFPSSCESDPNETRNSRPQRPGSAAREFGSVSCLLTGSDKNKRNRQGKPSGMEGSSLEAWGTAMSWPVVDIRSYLLVMIAEDWV